MNPVPRERTVRIVRRASAVVKVIQLTRNWPAVLTCLLSGQRLTRIRLRAGGELHSPPELDLGFLFHEIWVERMYSASAYRIQASWNVIDVGANIGVFAVLAAHGRPGVRVIACEPHPGNATWLRDNLARCKLTNVLVKEVAVAGAAGARALAVDPTNWLVHTLQPSVTAATIQVPCVSLGGLLQEFPNRTCDLLKLDCEGSEHEILETCDGDTLLRVSRIVAEFHPAAGGRDGTTLRRLLERHGYSVDFVADLGGGTGIVRARRGPVCSPSRS